MSTVINLDDAHGMKFPPMSGAMVRLTEEGHVDEGAFQRAVAIARDLVRLGHWDGQSEIRIADAYAIYNSLDHYVTVAFEEEYQALVVRRADPPLAPAPEEDVREDAMQVSTLVMGTAVSGHVTKSGYEISLFDWSGRRDDASEIDSLIKFLTVVKNGYQAFQAGVSPELLAEELKKAFPPKPEQFQIPAPDQAPNITAAPDALRLMFDEPELAVYPFPEDGHTAEMIETMKAALSSKVKCVDNDPDCPNTGWPLPCVKCNFCSQNLDEDTMEGPEDENQDVDSSWFEPATDEDFESQSGGSDYMWENYDEDDEDDWPEQAVSRYVRIAEDGHISIFEGVLSRYKGEDWGEASGWDEYITELDELTEESEQKVREFAKDKAPGDHDIPYDLEIELVEDYDTDDFDDEDEDTEITSTGAQESSDQ